MSDNDLIRRGQVLERLELAEHDAEERDWRSGANEIARLRKYVAAIPAAQPTVSPDVAALVEALEWYISEDETNEGDEPMPDHGNRSWNEINSYWIEGKRKAEAALARVKGVM